MGINVTRELTAHVADALLMDVTQQHAAVARKSFYDLSISFSEFDFEFEEDRDHVVMWSVIIFMLVWIGGIALTGQYERYRVKYHRRRIMDEKIANLTGKAALSSGRSDHSPLDWILHRFGASAALGGKHEEAKGEEEENLDCCPETPR